MRTRKKLAGTMAAAMSAMLAASCAGSAPPTNTSTEPSPQPATSGSEAAPATSATTASSSPAPQPTTAPRARDAGTDFNVSGRAPGDDTIDISASSDLPPNIPSTAQPYVRVIDAAVAPTRGALAECMRPLGAPARRRYRVLVRSDGRIIPRPPQAIAMPHPVASCVEAVVRGTLVNPPPPMEIPYDIAFDVEP